MKIVTLTSGAQRPIIWMGAGDATYPYIEAGVGVWLAPGDLIPAAIINGTPTIIDGVTPPAGVPKDYLRWDGAALIEDDSWSAEVNRRAAILAEARQRARRIVDAEAEATRLCFLTPGAGQANAYREKIAEAKEWQAAGSPAAGGDWPLIDAEVGITGADRAAVASAWLDQRAQWKTIAAQIEAIRMGGKAQIATAEIDQIEGLQAAALQALAAIKALA